jgi:hypothetical protein
LFIHRLIAFSASALFASSQAATSAPICGLLAQPLAPTLPSVNAWMIDQVTEIAETASGLRRSAKGSRNRGIREVWRIVSLMGPSLIG